MKLIKEKKAILFFYIAISIAISGYFYVNPDVYDVWDGKTYYNAEWRDLDGNKRVRRNEKWTTKTYYYDNMKITLVIEGAGLFLLLGWFAYKEDK